jgi:hypothetical protein
MAHLHAIEDKHGDIVDAEYFCSDFCHREAVGDDYRGWNGCVEISVTQRCENEGCGEILDGVEEDAA